MLVTPEMGGKIVLSAVQKGKGQIDHVHVEIDKRGIELRKPLEKMKWKEVTNLLKIDDYKRLIGLELVWDIEHWTRVLEIEHLI